ncbi:hypothetical protein PIB30_046001 [Stylosanthes scabra]|uniref:Uncharacterized protein n=1 Tax=Stylosanthes scabra TaxID=79078 RepID=A0ABU6VE81_9FABA|nr:hypothetical protein [Stylosanthes scabra]
MSVAQRERSTSSVKGTRSFRRGTASGWVRKPRSWELIPPSEGWMCDADDEKEIGGMDPSEKGESSEEDPKMEEEYPEEAGNPEDRVPTTPSLPMDIDPEEDFQRYVEELGYSINLESITQLQKISYVEIRIIMPSNGAATTFRSGINVLSQSNTVIVRVQIIFIICCHVRLLFELSLSCMSGFSSFP